tara:strand:+ start:597 stop:854 length:258 start_codon:yes stop_codon:yes gene_type:complete
MNKVDDMVSLIMLLEKGQQAFLDALRNKNLTTQMWKIAQKMWIKKKKMGHDYYTFMLYPLDYYDGPEANIQFAEVFKSITKKEKK